MSRNSPICVGDRPGATQILQSSASCTQQRPRHPAKPSLMAIIDEGGAWAQASSTAGVKPSSDDL